MDTSAVPAKETLSACGSEQVKAIVILAPGTCWENIGQVSVFYSFSH